MSVFPSDLALQRLQKKKHTWNAELSQFEYLLKQITKGLAHIGKKHPQLPMVSRLEHKVHLLQKHIRKVRSQIIQFDYYIHQNHKKLSETGSQHYLPENEERISHNILYLELELDDLKEHFFELETEYSH
ncbi:hypothetical protein AAG747_15855 [Rapidithrix thailandica]|uniref:Uncharacterized protein n=1 Tax=Rapidithrix thailandica TaxID=413964 RepID=A0AAW9S8T7_9BACT